MIIEESDFKLVSVGLFWDLHFKTVKADKDGQPSEKLVNAGYGMPLENCLRKIIHKRMEDNKEAYTLKEYLDTYVSEKAKFKEILSRVETVITEEGGK